MNKMTCKGLQFEGNGTFASLANSVLLDGKLPCGSVVEIFQRDCKLMNYILPWDWESKVA